MADEVVAVSVAAWGWWPTGGARASGNSRGWTDRARAQGTVGDPDSSLLTPRISPDGRRVVVTRTVEEKRDLWLLDGARMGRVTFDPASTNARSGRPTAPESCFGRAEGVGDLYEMLTNGGGEKLLVGFRPGQDPTSWSATAFCYISASTRTARRPVGRADGGASNALIVPEDPLSRVVW